MNFVIDLAHRGVSVAQWLSISAWNPKVQGLIPHGDSEFFSLSHAAHGIKLDVCLELGNITWGIYCRVWSIK